MTRTLALVAALCAAPLAAQDHSGHAPQPLQLPPPKQAPLQLPGAPPLADPHAGMDHSQMDHSRMDHGPKVPEAPPPPRASEGPLHAADAIWGAEAMARAREESRVHHGAMKTGLVMLERLEARLADGHDAYLWDAEAWYGGDIDKLYLKSEGEGAFGGAVDDAEVQALWSRAIGPFFDLQTGIRLDFEPETRAHLALGVQGLAPYIFHVDAAAYLSDRGDLTAKIESEYDQKITQSLILQPRMELELSAQDIPERGVGAGLVKVEAGLRLRYEIAREFAPYVGVEYEAKLGETADIARAAGDDPDGVALVLGLRAWF
jgi:copper resistance protein B